MKPRLGRPGAAFLAALCFACPPAPALAQAAALAVTGTGGEVLFHRPIAEGTRWCMRWNHSVAGFAVSDCYRYDGGRMMLEKSHQPDFAAGLGHSQGRGVMRAAAGGGYWIEGIDEAVPGNCYRLRIGSSRVDHRILLDGAETSLSARAAGQAATVAVRTHGEGDARC